MLKKEATKKATAILMVMATVLLSGCPPQYGSTDLCNPEFYIEENALYFQALDGDYVAGEFSFTFTPNTCTGASAPQASASYDVKVGVIDAPGGSKC